MKRVLNRGLVLVLWSVMGMGGEMVYAEEAPLAPCRVDRVSSLEGESQFLLEIAGQRVDAAGLPFELQHQLNTLDREHYHSREQVFRGYVFYHYVLSQVQASNGKKTFQQVQEEVLQVPEPTEEEGKALYEERKHMMPGVPYSQVASHVLSALKKQKQDVVKQKIVDQWIEEKKARFLTKPVLPLKLTLQVEGAPVKGPAKAHVEVITFSDFRCGSCREAHHLFNELLAAYGDKMKLVYVPVSILGEASQRLAVAAMCAHGQGKFWQFHDEVYTQPGTASIMSIAGKLKLDKKALQSCIDGKEPETFLQTVRAEFDRIKARATPFIYINGRHVEYWNSIESLKAAVDETLAQSSASKEISAKKKKP